MPEHDLIVIGAGPGGYVAAIRAAQLGLNVAVIEKEDRLGGTCLRVGCIPSKALLESSHKFCEARDELAHHGVKLASLALDLPTMLRRKDEVVSGLTDGVAQLLKKNKITRYQGHGRIVGREQPAGPIEVRVDGAPGSEPVSVRGARLVIATGSLVAPLPGVDLDGDRIGTSSEALSYPTVPAHLVVIGAGYIGLELGSVWRRLGAKVTVLEYLPRILPGMDSEIAEHALRVFKKQGLEFQLGCRVTAAKRVVPTKGRKAGPEGCVVHFESAGTASSIECDRVLLAVGRVPNTQNLGLETLGIQLDAKGRVAVDGHLQTSVAGVFAIGDVIAGPMLAHKAEEEGVAVAEFMVRGYGHVNYDAIPGVVYTHPEIASVGRTEDELKQAGTAYRKGVFQFRANARARCVEQIEGRIKVLADAKTDRVLGVHILGHQAGDLIAEAAVAIAFGASSEDLARACHAHPTLAEALKEAALAVDGRAIHS